MVKYFVILISTVSTLMALSYSLPFYEGGKQSFESVELTMPKGWKYLPKKEDSKYSDYLQSPNKSVYVVSSLHYGEKQANFLISRKINKSQPHKVGKSTVYLTLNRKDGHIDNYAYARYLGDGYTFYASMIPYPKFNQKFLEEEHQAMLDIVASIELKPKATNAKKNLTLIGELDAILLQAKAMAMQGDFKGIQKQCRDISIKMATFEVLKVDISPNIKSYAKDATTQCTGILYTTALQNALSKKGEKVCEELETSLQRTSLNNVPKEQFKAFQNDYRKVCPNRFDGGI